jgi:hypothetical protein
LKLQVKIKREKHDHEVEIHKLPLVEGEMKVYKIKFELCLRCGFEFDLQSETK